MPSLTLYTHPMSRGRTARWMLEEVGEPYETVILEYGADMKAADYCALNPMGKVPALTHGNTVVTETAAICAYLADAFPEAALAPLAADRGSYYRWLFFAAGPVEAAVTAKALGLLAPEDKKGMTGYGSFEDTIDALETSVANSEYVCGDRFTAADVVLGAQIGWGMMFKTIAPRPAFSAYWERLSARPAYKRASQTDDAIIAEKEKAKEPA